MPGELTKVDVGRIAALARLALGAEEQELYRRQLAEILEHARQVAAVDTRGVPPTTHTLLPQPSERPDGAGPSLAPAEALANAPEADRAAGLFKVPRVISG
jgi:aspartyl-tRNA(Asn)/glutamyl-tRNA(Gln) amidotransferase subunit C